MTIFPEGGPLIKQGIPEVDFEEETHTYRVDGEILPGVTSILSRIGATKYWGKPGNQKMSIGTAAHHAIYLYEEGDLCEDIDPRVMPYLDAYIEFAKDYDVKPLLTEHILYHPIYRYCGQTDMVCLWSRYDGPVLVDFKCGPHQPGYSLQTAGYAMCLNGIVGRAAIELKQKPGRDGKPYKIHDHSNESDLTVFRGMAASYQWLKANGRL